MIPQISTLIPAYRVDFLPALLVGLARQTFRSFTVVVSDDSPDGGVSALMHSDRLKPLLRDLSVHVVDGPRKGAAANMNSLLERWNGATPLAHLLMDDDLIYPSFYEEHMAARRQFECECSVSKRWVGNIAGQPVGQLPIPDVVRASSSKIVPLDQKTLFRTAVPRCNNWLGELSNSVLSRRAAERLRQQAILGISYDGLGDIGLFLDCAEQRPTVYIQEALGMFRVHGRDQHSNSLLKPAFMAAHMAWLALAIAGKRLGHLSDEDVRSCFRTIGPTIVARYRETEEIGDFVRFLSSDPDVTDENLKTVLDLWSDFHRRFPNL